MKECFAITTYCNTEEKIQVLNKTIDNLKQYELPIFIHAHYPLSDDIQKKAHSYFYSSDNPILTNRFNKFWYFIEGFKLEITVYDYYFTTLKGWSESIKICNDYDKIHMINYDANIYPELFNLSIKYNKSIFLQNPDKNLTKPFILPTYFCLKKESFEFFRENITLEKYIGFREISTWKFLPLVEEFIPYFTIGDDFLQIPYTDYNAEKLLENDIASDTRFDWNKSLSLNGTKIFIGDLNNEANILFFNVEKELEINAMAIRKLPVQPGTNMGGDMGGSITSDSLMSLYIPLSEIDELKIKINGERVSDDLIKKFIQLESKIYRI
jgi:hypothetical protein